MEKQSTVSGESPKYLPDILGATAGVLVITIILILIFWYRRRAKARRTLKWKKLGIDTPPRKNSGYKKYKLQRQKTIEFELPMAPRFVTTSQQVQHERCDTSSYTPTGPFYTPTVSVERRASTQSTISLDSIASAGGSSLSRERVKRQTAVLHDTQSDYEEGKKLNDSFRESSLSDQTQRHHLRRGSTARTSSVSMEELEISLYTTGTTDDELSGVGCVHSRGRFLFSVCHDVTNSCLIVNVHRAVALKTTNQGNKNPNSFVHASLWPNTERKQHFSTPVYRASACPDYDQSFCFTLDDERYDIDEVHVRFVVQSCEITAGRQRVSTIGEVFFDLRLLETLETTGSMLDVWRDIVPAEMDPVTRGELQISLCFEETESRLRAKVVDLSVKNIHLPEHICTVSVIDFSDPFNVSTYVKVLLISNDQVQKRRRSTLQKCCPENPHLFTFNEEYIFPITAPSTIDDLTVTFTVTCRDAQGHSLTLGKANVGSLTYTDGEGLLHWKHMLKSPSEWVTISMDIT